jgi:hypothetical protein
LRPVVDAFKSAQLFIPTRIHDFKPNASTVDTLRSFKFLDNNQIVDDLKSELPIYLALTKDILEVDSLIWWEKNGKKIPFWANACKKILLCQPSSASVERVFSLLKHFTEQQQSALEDYIECGLMIQYNHRND